MTEPFLVRNHKAAVAVLAGVLLVGGGIAAADDPFDAGPVLFEDEEVGPNPFDFEFDFDGETSTTFGDLVDPTFPEIPDTLEPPDSFFEGPGLPEDIEPPPGFPPLPELEAPPLEPDQEGS